MVFFGLILIIFLLEISIGGFINIFSSSFSIFGFVFIFSLLVIQKRYLLQFSIFAGTLAEFYFSSHGFFGPALLNYFIIGQLASWLRSLIWDTRDWVVLAFAGSTILAILALLDIFSHSFFNLLTGKGFYFLYFISPRFLLGETLFFFGYAALFVALALVRQGLKEIR